MREIDNILEAMAQGYDVPIEDIVSAFGITMEQFLGLDE